MTEYARRYNRLCAALDLWKLTMFIQEIIVVILPAFSTPATGLLMPGKLGWYFTTLFVLGIFGVVFHNVCCCLMDVFC